MALTASALRSNIYRMLDQVADSGQPLTLERKGHCLKIIREDGGGRLSRLHPRRCIKDDPEALVHIDWSETWHRDLP